MRITLSLDNDVAAALERLRKARNAGLKQLVNEALRRGLAQMASPPAAPCRPFRTQPLSLGPCRFGDVDNVAQVIAIAEGESFD